MTANPTPAWWRVIDWRTVLAAGLPAWLLVFGVVAWFKLTPKREPAVVHVAPQPVETTPLARLAVEESPMPRALRESAALPRLSSEEAPAPRAALDKPVDPTPVVNLVEIGRAHV